MRFSKITTALAAVFAVAAVAVFLVSERYASRPDRPISHPLHEPVVANSSSLANDDLETPKTMPSQDQRFERVHEEREKSINAIANTPISFFGKVIDQYKQPIVGAQTQFIVGSLSLHGSPTEQGPVTGPDGEFAITDRRGPDLTVSVERAGYDTTPASEQHFEYARGPYMADKAPPALPTKASPAIFVLRKKGEASQLVYFQKIPLTLPLNGKTVALDLLHGHAVDTPDAIYFRLQSRGNTLPLNEFYPFEWSLNVEVPNGGLLSRHDDLAFEAPPDGYTSTFTILMPVTQSSPNWKSGADQGFFVKLATGRYGRFRIHLSAESGRGYIESYVNPTPGDRNLEFDPVRQIKVP
jgi:hypothetical protein